jgi:metal-responsive CopG/Arc/MetJ family transcriptional regulator
MTVKKKRGRPRVARADAMVAMSVSVPMAIRELVDELTRSSGDSRSTVATDLLRRGLANPTIKRRLGKGAGG